MIQDTSAAEPVIEIRRIGEPSVNAVDAAARDDTVWVASNGGGLIRVEPGQTPVRIDLGNGLPSSQVLEVEIDGAGRVLAGSRGGLVVLESALAEPRLVELPAEYGEPAASVDLVIASRREARAVFQVTEEDSDIERGRVATLWKITDKEISRWGTRLSTGAEATTAGYDDFNDCLLLAGVRPAPDRRQLPWIARECPDDRITLIDPLTNVPVDTIGVAAIVHDPRREVDVLALVTQPGLNPAGRRFVLVDVSKNGSIRPHCSGFSDRYEVTGLAINKSGGLRLAMYGGGIRSVACDGEHRAVRDGDERLRWVLAMRETTGGKLLMGTKDAVFVAADPEDAGEPILQSPAQPIWTDSLPSAERGDGGAILASSANRGVLELVRSNDTWTVGHSWRAGLSLPSAVYGPAVYGDSGEIIAVARSQGLVRISEAGWRLQGTEQGLRSPHVLGAVGITGVGVWVAFGATPLDKTGAGLQLLRDDDSTVDLATPESILRPSGALLPWPDGRVWAATPFGVIEADASGRLERLSQHRVNKVFRNSRNGEIAAVGSTIERWNGDDFEPVLFRVEGQPNQRPLGHPVDVVVDDRGRWIILYSEGRIVLLDARRRFVGNLGPRTGIPPSSANLLYSSRTGEVIIGTTREGLHVFRWE